jgi:hypothetical protein
VQGKQGRCQAAGSGGQRDRSSAVRTAGWQSGCVAAALLGRTSPYSAPARSALLMALRRLRSAPRWPCSKGPWPPPPGPGLPPSLLPPLCPAAAATSSALRLALGGLCCRAQGGLNETPGCSASCLPALCWRRGAPKLTMLLPTLVRGAEPYLMYRGSAPSHRKPLQPWVGFCLTGVWRCCGWLKVVCIRC